MNEAVIRTVDPLESQEWETLLARPEASIFHSREWMQVVKATYGLAARATILERAGQPEAGVLWTEADNLLGHRRTTLACADFCDVLAGTEEDARTLANVLLESVPMWNLRTRSRNAVHVEAPVRGKAAYALQTIDLTPEDTSLWTDLTSMARRGVRKAQREGVSVRAATSRNELREWFLLHLRIRRSKHRLLAQPYAFFEHVWDQFIARGQGFLLLAIYQDQIIGGDLFLTWKDQCYYKFNASDTAYLHLRPNNLLLWHGMLEAKYRECRVLDLGRSPRENAGLIAFKQGFGAREETLYACTYDLRQDRQQACHELEAKEMLRSLTHLFVRSDVPESVTEEAGARLYRYFV